MKKWRRLAAELIVKRWWIIVILAVLASFTLILFMGLGQNVWFDESYSILLARQSIPALISLTGVDAHPPLYYIVLKEWAAVFGWGELALRSLSAVFAAATVGVVALLIRRLFSVRVMLVALPFLIMAPFWVRYGYEIRMYAMAGFIGALATFVLTEAVKRDTWRWWLFYAVLVATGMYTLYMTVIFWLAHVVWLFIYKRKGKKLWDWHWARAYAVALAIFAIYIPTVIFQYTHSALPGIGQRINLSRMGDVLGQLFVYTPEWELGGWTTLGIIVVLGLTIYLGAMSRKSLPAPSRQKFYLMALLALTPLVFFVVISLPPVPPIFITRYLAEFSIFIYGFIGVIAALGWRYGYKRAAIILISLSIVLLGWGDIKLMQTGNYNYERLQKPDIATIRKKIDCNTSTVIADDPYTYINDLYYLGDCDLRFYSENPVEYHGGYAWLAYHGVRVASPADATAKQIVHIYWSDHDAVFRPDNRYRQVSSLSFNGQVIDTYKLIAE